MHFCLTNMECKNSFLFQIPNFRFTSKILMYILKISAVNRIIHRNSPSVIFLPKKKVTGEFTKQNHLFQACQYFIDLFKISSLLFHSPL